MLIGILVIVWIAVLTPIIVRRFRDRDTDRSIVSFHERMAHLGTEAPCVEPAHRLDIADEAPPREVREFEMNPPNRAPKLRVVPFDASPGDLERDQSWDDWSVAHSDEPVDVASPVRRPDVTISPRAAAYARVPTNRTVAPALERGAYGSRSQRDRRRRVLVTLVGCVVLSSIAALLLSEVIIELVALMSWITLASFLGLMYYAMTTGMIATAGTRAPRPVEYGRVASAPRTIDRWASSNEDVYETGWDDDFVVEADEPRYARAL
jgi:hypothetical protein